MAQGRVLYVSVVSHAYREPSSSPWLLQQRDSVGAARRGVGLGQTREMFMLLGAKLLMLLMLVLIFMEFPTLSRGRGTMSWVLVKGIPLLTV